MPAGFLVAAALALAPGEAVETPEPNHAPRLESKQLVLEVGEFHRFFIRASDPDGDRLSYRVVGLPGTALFDEESTSISWRPGRDEVGQHLWQVEVSDGVTTTKAAYSVEVLDADRALNQAEWSAWLVPGLGYSYYRPRRANVWGSFHGPRLELSLGRWIHQTNSPGPSHGNVYLRVDVQHSTEEGVPLLFGYAGGFSLSFERNPGRSYLVPFYALEAGGLVHDEIGRPFELSPALGIHLFARQGLFVTLSGGYRLLPSRMTTLSGWHASLLLGLGLW